MNELLPEDDFWRTCLLGGLAVLVFPILVLLTLNAPEILVVGFILTFIAWAVSRNDAADATNEKAPQLDALETLRKRYANGDIGETEFEQRLDRLLQTESSKPREKELSFE
ncbi:SHOCT domain-containing protein [Haladaptatus sp. DFWS20]|uniref:SHOCT domain-containing protein n=1 Tax=Haladaptatus sp. DFWS20 TaxID=3403467 RepID=UPI003EBCB7DC